MRTIPPSRHCLLGCLTSPSLLHVAQQTDTPPGQASQGRTAVTGSASVAGVGIKVRAGVDLGILTLAAVYVCEFYIGQPQGAWSGEFCRDGRVGDRVHLGKQRSGVQGKSEWRLWQADACRSAAAICKVSGRRGQRRRARLRAAAMQHRVRARAQMHSAHARIACSLTSQVDHLVIGDLDTVGLRTGRKGRHNRRLGFTRLAGLRDTLERAGKARGVEVQVVDEGGTTGTCPWCLIFKKRGNEVRSYSCCAHVLLQAWRT